MRLLLFLCLSFLLCDLSYAQVNLTQGLVASYPFNGNASDASGNGHDGQLVNGIGLTTDRFGKANSAYLFDGIDDYITIPDKGAFSTPTFSVVLWFQTSSSKLQNLIGKRDFNDPSERGAAQYQFFINYPPFPGIGSNIVGNNSTCTHIVNSSYINTDGWICSNKWYFAVVTFDGTKHRIYIDGVLKREEAANFNGMLSCNSDLRFGNWHKADLIPFEGKMDDIQWYNRALNQQEISALYDNFPTLPGSCTASSPDVNSNINFCSGFQLALGGTGKDRAYDVAVTSNNQFFMAGTSSSFGSGNQILVSKLTESGTVIWSKTYGDSGNELIRKITPASDGGLLLIGQTKSYSNAKGEILCMKIDRDGNLLWSRKFGVGSANGDLGTDIIETSDGGYALTGILNVIGMSADLLVMKLNSAANPLWSKRFDRGDGEDGGGLLQKGDTLIVASDLQNSASHYSLHMMKLKLADGSFLMSRKLVPAQRGLFNPSLYKNPVAPGYIVSGHTIDYSDYSKMQHTVLTLTEDFAIVKSRTVSFPAYTNDYFTGFAPMDDGGFLGCATTLTSADAYIYRINDDNTVSYSKRFNNSNDRRLYQLAISDNNVIAVGSAVATSDEDFFITSFKVDGTINAGCDVENVPLTVEQPAYTVITFTWPSITDVSFTNTTVAPPSGNAALQLSNLCTNASALDFTYQQGPCYPQQVQFTKFGSGYDSYRWDLGNGDNDNNSINPIVWYDSYQTYTVKLKATTGNGCTDSVVKQISILNETATGLIIQDTTICKGASLLLHAPGSYLNFCWQDNSGWQNSSFSPAVTPMATTTYKFSAEVPGDNLLTNADFSAGNTGFTSDYAYNVASGTSAGSYTVATDAQAWNTAYSSCIDHTGGNGKMLMVNFSKQALAKVWSQTVPVQPNTNYVFIAWMQNFYPAQQTMIRFSINGKQVSDPFSVNASNCQWGRKYITWNSGSNTSATVAIESWSPLYVKNGFALDDLFFGKVSLKTDSINITVIDKPVVSTLADTAICSGASVVLSTQASGAIRYQWSPATGLSNSMSINPTAAPAKTTDYVITATGNGGCAATDTVRVTVRTAAECNATTVIVDFTAPDTVCVNTPVTITNTSAGASSYYWNFCVANSSTNPVGTNLGNFGFTKSVFIDYAKDGDNYYAFVTNNTPGKLVRLDFGNSLLNTPTPYDFGNFGGVIPDLCEGIQVVQNEGRWYAIIVGGSPVGRIVKIDFGPSLVNDAPAATNWGNIGGLAYPVDLHLFQSGDKWYGLTINAETSSITRFDFTNSFDNIPTGVNLGNIGGLNYPTGIYAVNNNNKWYAFVSNAGSGVDNSPNSSLTRLDFGNSLLNTPSGVNLGNPGNLLRSARDLTIYQSCSEIFGYVVNYSSANDIVRLNFSNSITTVPSAQSIGNTGELRFPHCISKLFRVENDLYSFIANVDNNTITRLKFDGCNGADIPGSTLQNPPAVTYTKPGTYNINLIADDGFPTQSSVCRQVVVLPAVHTPLQRLSICSGDSVLLTSSTGSGNQWNNGSTANALYAKSAGTYWVQSLNSGGCINIDSFEVAMKPLPVINLGSDTTLCLKDSLLLDAGNAGAVFQWQNGQTSQKLVARQGGLYAVLVTKDGCSKKDSIAITPLSLPVVSIAGKTTICKDGKTDLAANGGTLYTWSPTIGLAHPTNATTTASPAATTKYYVSVTGQNGCSVKDSVTITVTPKPVFAVSSSKPVLCFGDTATLTASGGDTYTWSPAATLSDPFGSVTKAFPFVGTRYKVVITENNCAIKDSLYINLPVASKPAVTTTKSNNINCVLGEARLHTGGGSQYLWQPSTGLSDSTSNNPVVRIQTTTTYHLFVTTNDGCKVEDSITVFVENADNGNGFPVPNAFTPNDDGKNDCFGVKYWGDVAEFSMRLYNRWGLLVFETNQPTECWNGFFRGKPQPGDVYVYLIKAKTRCGDVFRKGTFTLIR